MSAHVRPIAESDRADWERLFRAYGVFYATTFDDDAVHRVWAWLGDGSHEVNALVAELDGAVIGFAHYRRQADTFTGGPGWFLDDLYVQSDARGEGVGRSLIEAVAAEAGTNGGGTLRWITAVDNTTAQGLYDSLATRTTWVTYEKNVD